MVAVNYKASLMRRPTLRERIQGSRPLFFSSSLSLSFHLCVCVFERLEILWPCFNDLSKISHVSPIPIPSLLFFLHALSSLLYAKSRSFESWHIASQLPSATIQARQLIPLCHQNIDFFKGLRVRNANLLLLIFFCLTFHNLFRYNKV